ncbi:MAG TPA: hypothetical protein VJS88_01360 [Chthoniobacterales bacterium]|nr:hypothetical protein [Chthoniobacterales bacterium]
MAAPEHHRSANLAVPRLPLPAILAFAIVGLGGSVFLAFTSFSHGEAHYSVAKPQDVPVYSARAVPFERQIEDAAERAASIVRALTATPTESQPSAASDREGGASGAAPTLLADASRDFRGFLGFSAFGANTYLTLTATAFGISAQSSPSGFVAPDAETLVAAAVPETPTWLCGAALVALVAGRGIRASRVRSRRRIDE